MTLMQLERRVKVLEKKIDHLNPIGSSKARRWYRTHAGRFANDPVFDEIVKLGRAYRNLCRTNTVAIGPQQHWHAKIALNSSHSAQLNLRVRRGVQQQTRRLLRRGRRLR